MQRRDTKNKELILDLFKEDQILSASQIADQLPQIDFSTIFRNLKRFVQDGLLREIQIDAKQISYESTEHLHDHFVCNDCHQVLHMDIKKDKLSKILPDGVEAEIGNNVFHGRCQDCL